MPKTSTWMKAGMLCAMAAAALGCGKDDAKPAAVDAAPPPAPTPSTPASTPPPAPTASAPPVDCPKGSAGEGSFTKPCDAKGNARMMEVVWTGKTDDKGPSFKVQNKSTQVILYGRIAVYFYDKAGKQLEVKDPSATPPKGKPYHTCGGNMFQGVMKAGEKAVITFSCVSKDNVPDGAVAIEAEMPVVGFADASEKKVDAYWRNNDITPDVRKKGGVK